MSHTHEIYHRNPTMGATMNSGIEAMPPWTFAATTITAWTTALIGMITPEQANQWIGVMVNLVVAIGWLYAFYLRTRAKPMSIPPEEPKSYIPPPRVGSNMRDEH